MRTSHVFVLVGLCAAAGCKSASSPTSTGTGTGSGGTGTGSSGGGKGGWTAGEDALLSDVNPDGTFENGAPPISGVSLFAIACRNQGEAWVVGDAGTTIYTDDGGDTWSTQTVPTTATLRSVATQDDGPVFLVGDGAFLESDDTGATWQSFGDGTTSFRSVSAASDGATVLAIASDGGVWSYDGGAIQKTTTLAGAHAVAISPDGMLALVVGQQAIWKSSDAGFTWTALDIGQTATFDDIHLDQDGNGVAVGDAGAVALIDPSGTITMTHVGTANLHTVHIGGWGSVGSTGFTAGDGGQVYISDDNGWNWHEGPDLGRTVYGIDSIGLGHR